MNKAVVCWALYVLLQSGLAFAQEDPQVAPRVLTKTDIDGKVTVVDVAAQFVTTIRLPDPVNSVVVGDPNGFQVEHSDREPKLVFVKATSKEPGETNLLISTATGHQVSLLLINRGAGASEPKTVDFLIKYDVSSDFFVEPSAFPFALVGATVPLAQGKETLTPDPGKGPRNYTTRTSSLVPSGDPPAAAANVPPTQNLDQLLQEQEGGPLPVLYGEHIEEESVKGDRVRAGVSRVIDGGQQVIVLFSVVNPTKHAILLMPPQVQLGGTKTTGKVERHQKWTTAQQLPVEDFRLNRRRLGIGDRADGVVVFERPPYKQSNETLLLQVADSEAVDRPALTPIGFGVSTAAEEDHGRGK
jgi:hypothetical protein